MCRFFNKDKKETLWNLNESSAIDNKLIWKTVKPLKPFLSDKVVGKSKIHLTENGELIKTDLQTAEILNAFFSNTVQNLDITKYWDIEDFFT